MTFVATLIYLSLFITIIGLIVMNIMQQVQHDDFVRNFRRKPLKELLFPPILPIHRSPPISIRKPGSVSKTLPVIHV